MRKRLHLFLLLVVFSLPMSGRVLSYAPYTSRIASPARHERTTRHFLLLEAGSAISPERQLVLYDSSGAEEPRVVFPENGGMANIVAAALYEPPSSLGVPLDLPPVLLVMIFRDSVMQTLFSKDAGAHWNEVQVLRGRTVTTVGFFTDSGGPWTGGLQHDIYIGSQSTPFVLNVRDAETSYVVAVSNTGVGRVVYSSGSLTQIVGQNKDASRVLVWEARRGMAVPTNVLMIDTVTGAISDVARNLWEHTGVTGWIADDRSAYLNLSRADGQFLYRSTYRSVPPLGPVLTLVPVAGTRGVTPPDPTLPPSTTRTGLFFFAVPMSDFNGAWMVQRAPGQPTDLLRYTPGRGLEAMGQDISGPEIEALIPNRNDTAVLLQVHRDRATVETMLVDPAIAIWRVGEPMPRQYDELYLNEMPDKGFVHVDVDAIAGGEPFVFSSGIEFRSMEGPISSPIGGGADVSQEWGVVRASLRQRLILPGVARLQGAFDSQWRTDVTIYNPLDAAQKVDILYFPLGETESRTTSITLQAGEIRLVADALHALFAVENGGGALHFVPQEGVNVVGRTYSRKGEGTFGFGMVAIDAFNAAGPRFPVSFAGAFPGENFRTNILLTDTTGRGTEAQLRAYGASGPIGTEIATIGAPRGGIFQANGIKSSLNLLANDAGALVVQPTRGNAIATVVAIDNRTNDPTYFPPDLAGPAQRTIPVVGHLDGANGAHFRSDLYLYNAASQSQNVYVSIRRWDNGAVTPRVLRLLPHEARVIPDVLQTRFATDGLAALAYASDLADSVRVTSRTYTVDASGATYGSLIPPLNNFQIGASGDRLEILGAIAGSGFRTNIGLVELAPFLRTASTVRIRLLDEQRREIDAMNVEVPSGRGLQLNDVFRGRGIATPQSGLIVVEVLQGTRVAAYATMTDNVTNDTAYFGAQLGAK